jgi:hypothetical protein
MGHYRSELMTDREFEEELEISDLRNKALNLKCSDLTVKQLKDVLRFLELSCNSPPEWLKDF